MFLKFKNYLLLLLVFFCTQALATNNYWQQEVNYRIDVALNDEEHSLTGSVSIDYFNNSPDTLSFVYFHLYPNAYKDVNTAFGKQMLEDGNTDFYYSKEEERGYINSLNFTSSREKLAWSFDEKHIDIARVELNEPLLPNSSVTITTPFYVKIPESFSRLSHVGQSYQISQWYPKPAVYDANGWNQMPYLDLGEFYSEFGSYSVSITLPKNYVVAASGQLASDFEYMWLDGLASKSEDVFKDRPDFHIDSFPPSSAEFKTIHYYQEGVHDFAWFADKRYNVAMEDYQLDDGAWVSTWAFFTNNELDYWEKALTYIQDGLDFYTNKVGYYPYENCTAVDGTIAAGAGMEYPTITVIGESTSQLEFELTIAHEVGHNWFYGVLASNEREHMWLDESINSYYENRYLEEKYGFVNMLGFYSTTKTAKALDIQHYDYKKESEYYYNYAKNRNIDQPLRTPSHEFSAENYFDIGYGKGMMVVDYLAEAIGRKKFDAIMRKYYDEWKFKHPQPKDFQKVVEDNTEQDLSWFFDDLVKTTKQVDYAISSVKRDSGEYILTFKNRGEVNGPLFVGVRNSKGNIEETHTLNGFEKGEKVRLWLEADSPSTFVLDPFEDMPDVNRNNNTIRAKGLFKKIEKPRLQILGSLENPNRTQINFAPALSWNNYDKTQIGLAFYTNVMTSKKYHFFVAPMFGTGSKNLTGIAKLDYSWYPNKLEYVRAAVLTKRFSYKLFPEDLAYNVVAPSLKVRFKNKNARNKVTKQLKFKSTLVWQEYLKGVNSGARLTGSYYVNNLSFDIEDKRVINPYKIEANIEQGSTWVNTSFEAKYRLSYLKPKKGLNVRLFAGGFLYNNRSSSNVNPPLTMFQLSGSSSSIPRFQRDYTYDEFYFDRNGVDPVFSHQIAKVDGGFVSKTITGNTDKYLVALNINTTLPGKVPVRPFGNLAMYDNGLPTINWAAELGASIVVVPELFEIHVPFVTTNNIKQNQETLGLDKFYEKITFTLDINLLNPFERIRDYRF